MPYSRTKTVLPLAGTPPHAMVDGPVTDPKIRAKLPELIEINAVIDRLRPWARVETLAEVELGDRRLPISAVSLGPEDPSTPVLAFFAGVHGLERIGTQLLTSYMQTIAELLEWDRELKYFLSKVRLLFVPLVNPGGMMQRKRANPNGVDLMRNAPVEGDHLPKMKLLAGHRISPRLPWFRGYGVFEKESQAVVDFCEREIFSAQKALAVDIHSGFGAVDRLWFPYANSRQPFPNVPEVFALGQLLDASYPNHIYQLEPQSRQYTTHGDLWDYLYLRYRERSDHGLFLPLTLELGSWIWVKKNPKQMLSVLGAFNPMIPHRFQRTLRRHLILFQFLQKAMLAFDSWAQLEDKNRGEAEESALAAWFDHLEKGA